MVVVENQKITREPFGTMVIGQQGIGKTYSSKIIISQYVEVHKRPVLVFDSNNEFKYKTLYYDSSLPTCEERVHGNPRRTKANGIEAHTKAEIRRIAPFKINGRIMYDSEKVQAILDAAMYFRNGLFYMEDVNTYIDPKNIPKDFFSMICSMRHRGIDVIVQYQGITNPITKMFSNMRFIRLHKTQDTVCNIRNRIQNVFDVIRIAEILIKKRFDENDRHFYVHIDLQSKKISTCNPVPDDQKKSAVRNYLLMESTLIRSYKRVNNCSEQIAITELTNELMNYFN